MVLLETKIWLVDLIMESMVQEILLVVIKTLLMVM